MHFLYILRCADNTLSIGETDDLNARLAKHNDGRAASFTAARRPAVIVQSETYESPCDPISCATTVRRVFSS